MIPVSRPPIENGAVLLEGERIIAVYDYAAFEDTPGINREIGDSATWLLSGLINSHYHNGRSFQLGYSDEPGELSLFRTFSHVGLSAPTEAEACAHLNMLASAFQLLRAGVTTTVDMAWGGRTLGAPHDPSITAYRVPGMGVIFAPIARDRSAYVYGEDEAFLASLPPELAVRIRAGKLGQSIRITPRSYWRNGRRSMTLTIMAISSG